MNPLVLAIVEGATAFAATNMDDLLILMLFFAQVNHSFRPYHVVSGAYWGFAALVALSFVGFLGGLMVSPAWIGLLGILPIGLGLQQLWSRDGDTIQVQTVAPSGVGPGDRQPLVGGLLHPQAYPVAAVTFANGGDNIGIYVPLFATSNAAALGIILIVFFVLKGVWCYAAYRFTQYPQVAYALTRYGHRLMPLVLIGLGLVILWKNGTFELIFRLF